MSTIKKLSIAVASATMLFAGAVQAETVLTLSNWLPPTHPLVTELLKPMADDMARVTDGRVKVNILPAPLGPPQASFDLAKNGVADITFSVQGYTPGRFKTAAIGEMPFLGDNAVATSVAFWRVHQKYLAAAGEYDGVKVLAVFTHGPGQGFSKKPLDNYEDIVGQKIRVGGGIVHEIVSALGAVPVEGPSSMAYELLKQGVADGVFFPYESIEVFNLVNLLDSGFIVPGGLYNTAFFIVMNQGKWDSLSAEDRAAIETVIGEPLVRRAGEMWNRADARGLKAMEGKITLHKASEADMATLAEKLKPIVDSQIAVVTAAGVDGAAAYAMMREEIEKVDAELAK